MKVDYSDNEITYDIDNKVYILANSINAEKINEDNYFGYELNEGDIIKIGRFKIKVRKIKLIKKNLEEEKIGNNKKKDIQNVYLFTEAEKEVFQKIVPNELFNNLNDKFNEKEIEVKKIEETFKEQKEQKKKLYLDNLKYDEINLKKKELRMKKTNLMSENIKNNKKINEMKNIIKRKQKEIDNENRKIARFTEKNSTMHAILKKYIEERKNAKEQKEITN